MKREDIMILLASIAAVVVFWVGFNTYHAFETSKISSSLSEEITPIKPSFNTAVIQSLRQREQVNPVFSIGNASTSAATTMHDVPLSSSPSPTIATTSGRLSL